MPFENLSLHYSAHHTISLDPTVLYAKIVGQQGEKPNGRGGYCMENNALFASVLRGLGYDVYSVGARIGRSLAGTGEEGFGGW